MKFTLDARTGINLVRAYAPGELLIGERIVTRTCIVTADTLITDWDPPVDAALDPERLQPLLALEPQIVLWGISGSADAPSTAVRAYLAARAVGLESMDLGAACRTFNILVQEERRVAAVLFLQAKSLA